MVSAVALVVFHYCDAMPDKVLDEDTIKITRKVLAG
jgi:hypothetical protein